jgi:catalase (peroxidase I)
MEQQINTNALKSEIRDAVINRKANACPIMVRLAWHASGTFCKNTNTGGSNGANMRFIPEATDDANKGLHMPIDMLHLVKQKNPEVTYADLWTYAGVVAVEFLGGPKVEHHFGRTDHPDGKYTVENGRLPDAKQGAQHLRDVFYRMGFNDQEIVALSGAHTLGRCHLVRSGYDGPWTTNPLKFDNEYYRNLMHLEWREKVWNGPKQFEDVQTGQLMMLPTDMALKTDPEFKKYAELYANDEHKFFEDFAGAFAKLISLGCPEKMNVEVNEQDQVSAKFRELAMHGSLGPVKELASKCDIHQLEKSSGRSALHKAAFWGHVETVHYLSHDLKMNVNQQDYNGDTAMHDAVRFNHVKVVEALLSAGANVNVKNREGRNVYDVAVQYEKHDLANILKSKVEE